MFPYSTHKRYRHTDSLSFNIIFVSDEIQELEAIPSSATVGGSLGSPPAPLTPGGMENPLEQFSRVIVHVIYNLRQIECIENS